MGEIVPLNSENHPPEGLTCIHTPIHCAATPDTSWTNGHDELEGIDIDKFLRTLGEVAVSVARRQRQRENDESSRLPQGQ